MIRNAVKDDLSRILAIFVVNLVTYNNRLIAPIYITYYTWIQRLIISIAILIIRLKPISIVDITGVDLLRQRFPNRELLWFNNLQVKHQVKVRRACSSFHIKHLEVVSGEVSKRVWCAIPINVLPILGIHCTRR